MARLQLTIACGDYDRTRALEEGTVRPDGIELNYLRLPVEETFFRMMRHREFEVAEMSLSSYVKSLDPDEPPFVALPVFTSRMFRHGGIYCNADAGIAGPEDLRGKRVGTPEYQVTAGVWIRGILADRHGVPVDSVRVLHRRAGDAGPAREGRRRPRRAHASRRSPATGRCRRCWPRARSTRSQGPRVPSSFVPAGPVRRLFPDPVAAEKDYFAATGIFPIMHVVVVRRDVYERHPWVAQSLYKALGPGQAGGRASSTTPRHCASCCPWLIQDLEEAKALLGEDYWSYGLEATGT